MKNLNIKSSKLYCITVYFMYSICIYCILYYSFSIRPSICYYYGSAHKRILFYICKIVFYACLPSENPPEFMIILSENWKLSKKQKTEH